MHEILFSQAKNGSETCSADGIFLHSRYNPEKEAESFANSRQVAFEPSLVVVAGPALSYCARFLRARFPSAKLVAIEHCAQFKSCAKHFDDYFVAESPEKCAEAVRKIFFKYGEKAVSLSCFFSWPPSERAFREESENCLCELKGLLRMAASAVATRTFFGKRWAKNAFKFFAFAKNFAIPVSKCEKPILICASGKTLQNSLSHIKERRGEFFVIALSSALNALFDAGISPDLAFSADGGFYAKSHIASKKIAERQIPLAISPESAVNSEILEAAKILPLNYGDGMSAISDFFGAPSVRASRNGTVSGTALEFALAFSSARIFFCGLDLSAGKIGSISHAAPNACDVAKSIEDFRLRPLSTRLCAEGGGAALEIYASWFEGISAEKKFRIFRVKSAKDEFSRSLAGISDVNWEELPPQRPAAAPRFLDVPKKKETAQNAVAFARSIDAAFDEFCSTGGGDFAEKWLEELDFSFFLQWQKSGKKLVLDEKKRNCIKKLLRQCLAFFE